MDMFSIFSDGDPDQEAAYSAVERVAAGHDADDVVIASTLQLLSDSLCAVFGPLGPIMMMRSLKALANKGLSVDAIEQAGLLSEEIAEAVRQSG